MSESGGGPSLDPGSQVLVSIPQETNIVSYLPGTTGHAVIVAIRSSPHEVETALGTQGIDPTNAVVIPVGMNDPAHRGSLKVTGVLRPSDLPQLGRRISDRLAVTDGDRNWLVIDDLIVLLMYSGDERVFRFLRSVASRVRRNDIKAMYGIDRDAVSARTFNHLAGICEYHVDLPAD